MIHAHPIPQPARRSRGPILLALLLTATGAARAEENTCRSSPSLSAGPALTLGRISAPGRTAFVRDGLARAGCPDAGTSCRERAYLVAGDPVILGERRGTFLCATYRGGKEDALAHTGWVPADAVMLEPAAPITAEGWLGTWKRAEAEIRVTPGTKPNTLSFGEATWGLGDPERVRRGGVHMGEFTGTIAPAGDAASFAVGESATLPVRNGGEYDFKVWLRRLGPWLVVDDNLACGGANVTFRGVYRKRP